MLADRAAIVMRRITQIELWGVTLLRRVVRISRVLTANCGSA
jgi:hypothetical protein